VFAFLPSLGFQEMAVLVVIGLLLYGRNLPEAGRALGRVAAQFRRGLHEFKVQMDREGDLQEVKRTFQGTAAELKRAAEVPRAHLDPRRLLTNEDVDTPAAGSSPWHQETPGIPHDPESEPIRPPGTDWANELVEDEKLSEEEKVDEPEPPPPEAAPQDHRQQD